LTSLTDKSQIWETILSDTHITNAVHYAAKSVNWTFNRLAISGEWATFKRMMRIVTGVAAQQCLMSQVQKKGKVVTKDWSDYRTEDTFDLALPDGKIADTKASNHYREYDTPKIRPKFSLDYLIKCKDYSGRDYRLFFPCAVPVEQFDVKRKRPKDYYIFTVISSPTDFISERMKGRDKAFLVATVPPGLGNFLNYKKLVAAREAAGAGISLTFSIGPQAKINEYLSPGKRSKVYAGCERDGGFFEERIELEEGSSASINDISGFSYLRMDSKEFECFSNILNMEVSNHLTEEIYDSGLRNINLLPQKIHRFTKESFANLYIPQSKIYFLGWIDRSTFEQKRKKLPCYGPPKDRMNKYSNTDGTPPILGVLYPRSTCYIYPNVYRGGFINKNYYVLPRDLREMDELLDIV